MVPGGHGAASAAADRSQKMSLIAVSIVVVPASRPRLPCFPAMGANGTNEPKQQRSMASKPIWVVFGAAWDRTCSLLARPNPRTQPSVPARRFEIRGVGWAHQINMVSRLRRTYLRCARRDVKAVGEGLRQPSNPSNPSNPDGRKRED